MTSSPTKGLAAATVVTRNYFQFAVAWAESIYQTQPEVTVYICLVDRMPPHLAPEKQLPPNAVIVYPEALKIPAVKQFLFRYTPFELSCALKPFIVRHALQSGHGKVVYIDTDTRVYGDLNQLFDSHPDSSICLTPHIYKPLPDDGKMPIEQCFLTAGVYNGGFLGVVNDETGQSFVEWWGEKCLFHSIVDIAAGLHVDQKWIDLVPSLFDNVTIVRRDGLHVAYWNLLDCDIQRDAEGQVTVNGQPMVIFHYSGIDFDDPGLLSKYQNRLSLTDMPVVADLVAEYVECVKASDVSGGYSKLEYLYNTLRSGETIQREWREAMRHRHGWMEKWENPFDDISHPQMLIVYQELAPAYVHSRVDWRLAGLNAGEKKNQLHRNSWKKKVFRYLKRLG
ncbi:hypothetical protein M4951_25175 [Blastopirellula sp. J2-11]|uniref:hypothetical protein n=1 Tax=Blastopirellula sp. J2-11 TaxID=2943192 RepID=UPI0021C9E356|nr:hypothetical protein [Blastopirellula sp. J2-11]UUO06623.1 hypothetical protein M4951_25175 [Blastopirellula sp. J2-11]